MKRLRRSPRLSGIPRATTLRADKAKTVARQWDRHAYAAELAIERPRTRGECTEGEHAARPCPWVGCRYHLFLSVHPGTGTIQFHRPDLEPWDLEHSCALDVAELGGLTLEEVGAIMNVTRERSRQLEVRALLQLKRHGTF